MVAKKVQSVGLDVNAKRALIDPGAECKAPSLRRQCELIGLSRSSWYDREGALGESPQNLALMQHIDEIHTAYPFYGSRKMVAVLEQEGHPVNRKRVQRLLRLMGLQSIAPRPIFPTMVWSSFSQRRPLPRGVYDIQDSHLRFHDFIHDHVAAVNDQFKGARSSPGSSHSRVVLESCCSF